MATNCGAIAILPVVSKVLEKIVAAQLMEPLVSNQPLHLQHFGFRTKYSTELVNCPLTEGQNVSKMSTDVSGPKDNDATTRGYHRGPYLDHCCSCTLRYALITCR